MSDLGWQITGESPRKLAYYDGESWAPFRIAVDALTTPAILAAPYPDLGYDSGDPVHLVFDIEAGVFVVGAIPKKRLQNWQWDAPHHHWPLTDIVEVEVDVAGRRVSQGGLAGHVAGMATLGWSYLATTKGHDQTWLSIALAGGLAPTFLTEAAHARVLEGQLSPFRAAVRRTRIPPPPPPTAPPTPGEPVDAADQIRALAVLRDEGLLTEEEFQAKKRRILGL